MFPTQRFTNLSEPQPRIRPLKKIWLGIGLLLFVVLGIGAALSLFHVLPNTPQWNALGTGLVLLFLLWGYPYGQHLSGFRRFHLMSAIVVLAALTVLDLLVPKSLITDLAHWV